MLIEDKDELHKKFNEEKIKLANAEARENALKHEQATLKAEQAILGTDIPCN